MEATISLIVTLTRTGRRAKNEDSLEVREFAAGDRRVVIAAVADGMGGHLSGEVASRMAAKEFARRLELAVKSGLEFFALRKEIEATYQALNDLIISRYERDSELEDMGSTLTAAVFIGNRFLVGNLGDTRVYRITSDDILQVTKDHSAGAESVREGLISEIEAKESRYANTLTKFLGSRDRFAPDIFPEQDTFELRKGEVVLLCTDGISGVLDEIDIFEQVVESPTLQEAAERLADLSLKRGSKDNMSLVLIEQAPLERRPAMAPQKKAAAAPLGRNLRRKFLATLVAAFLILVEGFLLRCYIKGTAARDASPPALERLENSFSPPRKHETPATIVKPSQDGSLLEWTLSGVAPGKRDYMVLFFSDPEATDSVYKVLVQEESYQISDELEKFLRKYPAIHWQVCWDSRSGNVYSERKTLSMPLEDNRTK